MVPAGMSRRSSLTLLRRLCNSFSSSSSSSDPPLFSSHPADEEPEPEPPPSPSPPRLLPSPTADALAHLLLAHHNPYHPLEAPLQLTGTVALTPSLTLQTLLRLRHTSKPALAFFVWARDHAHHHPSPAAYELLVDLLARARQFDVAWQLILQMDRPTPRVFAVLIRRLVAAGLTRQAVRAFDDSEAFLGREPAPGEWRLLLDTLCKYGYPKVATEIFNKRKSTFPPDVNTYNIMIYGWCKVRKNEMAQKFFREMLDRGLEPTLVTYNILLNGVCRNASLFPDTRFDRTIRNAEGLLEEMRSRGIEPDATSYSIVLHVYSRAHKPELSVRMLRSMKEKGVYPTVATYTSVVKCLASCGRLQEAEEFVNEMASNGVCPSPATYNCFFKEYRGRNHVEGAMRMYKKMREKGSFCEPDMHTYNILIGMFLKLNKMEIVRELWKDMIESGVGPDLDSYTMLIHGLCEKQKWREACQFFMEMIEKGILPQKVTFETLYRGLIQANMLRTWRRLKSKVDEESLKFGMEFQQYHLKPYKR